ncbi:MAG: hypothetical protein KGV59_03145 [Tenacibaculum sp.]|nr:hypothetical protein [Tenacibaculum sp.]
MNKILKKVGIIFLPSCFWVLLTAFGFGAQSLSNIIELFAIFILSLFCALIPIKVIQFKYVIVVLFFITFMVRLLMPSIPE